MTSRAAEAVTVERVRAILESEDWNVDADPRLGSIRPDLVATAPDGKTYLFELKTYSSGSTLDYSDLAQVQLFLEALERSMNDRSYPVPTVRTKARAVFLTNRLLSDYDRLVSERLGVEVISFKDGENGPANALRTWLSRRASAAN